ncbi:MAG: hypothetical protein H6845_02675 [Alphaproteobacteria bacterium]|nr:MAG: hypothetical protein H6845_02675 [Alphaproteobacteria bacterium]
MKNLAVLVSLFLCVNISGTESGPDLVHELLLDIYMRECEELINGREEHIKTLNGHARFHAYSKILGQHAVLVSGDGAALLDIRKSGGSVAGRALNFPPSISVPNLIRNNNLLKDGKVDMSIIRNTLSNRFKTSFCWEKFLSPTNNNRRKNNQEKFHIAFKEVFQDLYSHDSVFSLSTKLNEKIDSSLIDSKIFEILVEFCSSKNVGELYNWGFIYFRHCESVADLNASIQKKLERKREEEKKELVEARKELEEARKYLEELSIPIEIEVST